MFNPLLDALKLTPISDSNIEVAKPINMGLFTTRLARVYAQTCRYFEQNKEVITDRDAVLTHVNHIIDSRQFDSFVYKGSVLCTDKLVQLRAYLTWIGYYVCLGEKLSLKPVLVTSSDYEDNKNKSLFNAVVCDYTDSDTVLEGHAYTTDYCGALVDFTVQSISDVAYEVNLG